MSKHERAVADFVGRFAKDPKGQMGSEPESGRIVMSQKRLVVAGDDERITIGLSNVVDVVVGNVPSHLSDLFDSTVTVGYKSDTEQVRTVLIEGDQDTISKFRTVLFRCLLNGSKSIVKHPARVGGRVTDTPVRRATLSVTPDHLTITTEDGRSRIAIANVIGFERAERSLDGTDRPTLVVRHTDDGHVTTTLLTLLSARRVNILGRYLRTEYQRVLENVSDVELSESETRLLVAVYTTGGTIDFGSILDGDAARATNVMNALRNKDLIEEDGAGVSLTTRGQILVTQRIEDVNI